jgi:pyruvate/2-oxoglutarate dehydrogenase complex dihydrolipoamide dehydrogenase (E3) component
LWGQKDVIIPLEEILVATGREPQTAELDLESVLKLAQN